MPKRIITLVLILGLFTLAGCVENIQKTQPPIKEEGTQDQVEAEQPPIQDSEPSEGTKETTEGAQELPQEESFQPEKTQKKLYQVIKVIDGDTIAVDIDGVKEVIRLIGINSPETVDPRKPVECFGKEASEKAQEVLNGKSVSLEFDSSQGEKDKYDRLLRYLFLEDGTNFNKLMIAEGFAYEYTYETPYKYQEEFKQAQKEAQESKRGIWAENICPTTTTTTTTQTTPTPTPEPEPQTITPPPSKSQTQAQEQPKSTPPSSAAICNCSGNIYNCPDFGTHANAQSCYNYCLQQGKGDIHDLDRDQDGSACETLP